MKHVWNGTKKPIRSSIHEVTEFIDDIPIETVTLETKEYESEEERTIFRDALRSMPKLPVTIEDFDNFYERLIVTATFRGFDLALEDI